MIYVQASIKLRPGKLPDFIALMKSVIPVIGKHGWKLIGSYSAVVGRFHTVLDLWELPEANAIAAALGDPAFEEFAPRIAEIIEDETLTVLTKLPI
ncbi:MAG: NIPSNAP family protein [Candidatus Binataceae bacterium]